MSLAAFAELAAHTLAPRSIELAISDLFAVGAIDVVADEHGADVLTIPGDLPSIETQARRLAAELDSQAYQQILASLEKKREREGGRR